MKLILSRLQDGKLDPVAIIGAGPVGLFTALLLAQKGIKVVVYETGPGINQSPEPSRKGLYEHLAEGVRLTVSSDISRLSLRNSPKREFSMMSSPPERRTGKGATGGIKMGRSSLELLRRRRSSLRGYVVSTRILPSRPGCPHQD